jgi:hypothetical protein
MHEQRVDEGTDVWGNDGLGRRGHVCERRRVIGFHDMEVDFPGNGGRVKAPRGEAKNAHVSAATGERVEPLDPRRRCEDSLRRGQAPRVGRHALDLQLGVDAEATGGGVRAS